MRKILERVLWFAIGLVAKPWTALHEPIKTEVHKNIDAWRNGRKPNRTVERVLFWAEGALGSIEMLLLGWWRSMGRDRDAN